MQDAGDVPIRFELAGFGSAPTNQNLIRHWISCGTFIYAAYCIGFTNFSRTSSTRTDISIFRLATISTHFRDAGKLGSKLEPLQSPVLQLISKPHSQGRCGSRESGSALCARKMDTVSLQEAALILAGIDFVPKPV
jgi:hypothetical protein